MVLDKYTRHELYEIGVLVIWVVLIFSIFSLVMGFGLGGFEMKEFFDKNAFYVYTGTPLLIGIIVLKLLGIVYFGKGKREYDGTFIHDPEQGPFKKLIWFRNPFLLLFFSVIIFSLLLFFATRYQVFFQAIPVYEQQTTKVAQLWFQTEPASTSETLSALFLINLLGFGLGWMVLKQKLKSYWFYIILIPGAALFSGFFGLLLHVMRYSGSDVAMSSVFIFWLFLGAITAITGSVIPALVLHSTNNFFVGFSKLFGSEVVTFVTFVTIGILIALFLLIWMKIRKRKVVET